MIPGITASRIRSLGDPFFSNVSLLLHMEDSNGSTSFIDSSVNPKTITVGGNAQISTAQSKFGLSSGYFDGNGDIISTSSNSTDFGFGTGDFTLELFIRFLDENTSRYFLGSDYSGSYFEIYRNASNKLVFDTSIAVGQVGTANLLSNTWYHIAISKSSGILKTFVDGIQQISYSDSANYGTSRTMKVGGINGGALSPTLYHYGWIDEVRVTKGIARYNSNFVSPTAPFPNQ